MIQLALASLRSLADRLPMRRFRWANHSGSAIRPGQVPGSE
mgnify:CR=1 FL=1